jgi:Type VI secretion system/phage-baseplate injector OB domain
MNGDPGRDDRPQLDDLVHRARTELRDWTDKSDHDPGVALVELFAFVGDLLSSYSDRVAEEARLDSGRRRPSSSDFSLSVTHPHRAYSSVVVQQGRVVLDADHQEEPPRTTCGVHQATVLDNADPLGQSRLLVRVPDVSGDQALWAAACLPASGASAVPAAGTEVWVTLEACDPSRPVWLGQRVTA